MKDYKWHVMSTLLNIVFQTPHEINHITSRHIRGLQPFKHILVANLKHFDQISDISARNFTLLIEVCADSEPMQIKNVK